MGLIIFIYEYFIIKYYANAWISDSLNIWPIICEHGRIFIYISKEFSRELPQPPKSFMTSVSLQTFFFLKLFLHLFLKHTAYFLDIS